MSFPFDEPAAARNSVGATSRTSVLGSDWVIGQSTQMRRVAQHAFRAAEVECTVLISGETGTGKEVWARAIHRSGPRAAGPFLPVNCAALTSTLAESQLFGHE